MGLQGGAGERKQQAGGSCPTSRHPCRKPPSPLAKNVLNALVRTDSSQTCLPISQLAPNLQSLQWDDLVQRLWAENAGEDASKRKVRSDRYPSFCGDIQSVREGGRPQGDHVQNHVLPLKDVQNQGALRAQTAPVGASPTSLP